ncbi:hypothetical protein [Polynucleobacter sp.]|uniref:hypothetical protein n=1 Tax=Polynucleobacter sp. TaxID=2029855 RepID=UPI003F6A4BFC
MNEQKPADIYCGSGKEKIFDNGGKMVTMSFNTKDLEIMNKWAAENNGSVRINILRRKEVSQFGQTHYGKLNQWKPDKPFTSGTIGDNQQDANVKKYFLKNNQDQYPGAL